MGEELLHGNVEVVDEARIVDKTGLVDIAKANGEMSAKGHGFWIRHQTAT
jgi:hypothetical protein